MKEQKTLASKMTYDKVQKDTSRHGMLVSPDHKDIRTMIKWGQIKRGEQRDKKITTYTKVIAAVGKAINLLYGASN